MNYLVIIICIVAIVVAVICKMYGYSMIFPTLIIIFAVLADVIVNTLADKKHKKEYTNLDDIKNKMKNKS